MTSSTADDDFLAGRTPDATLVGELDAEDTLAPMRERFHVPRADGRDVLYLCGNSLGLQPRGAAVWVEEVMQGWAQLGVTGHFSGRHPWVDYHAFATQGLARLSGAHPHEVVAMNTLTVNLHLMMASFYRPTGRRRRILIERGAFPSDRYAVESHLRVRGVDPDDGLVELTPREGESCLRTDDVCARIGELGDSLALVLLPGVQYYTGEVYDMATITAAAHRAGAFAGFDLAHAIGNVELALHDWNVDCAAWCTYKYLNAGPGAVAGAFIHERHGRDPATPRLAGWWGHDRDSRFAMGPDFVPMPGAEGFQLSNPPILSLAPLLASLALFDEAGMPALRRKSRRQWALMRALLAERFGERVQIITPCAPARHGCQLSLRLHGDARHRRHVFERLESRHVICDWREPDVVRVAPVPLYNSYADVLGFVDTLETVI